MLLKEPDLSPVQIWTLKQCQDFKFKKKRKNNPHSKRAARWSKSPCGLTQNLPSLPAVACRVPEMEDLEVHFRYGLTTAVIAVHSHNVGFRRTGIAGITLFLRTMQTRPLLWWLLVWARGSASGVPLNML